MPDGTYQPKQYSKLGGDVKVIANGGKIEVESGGEIEGQSGATFDAQTGFNFFLSDTTYAAETLKNFLRSQYTKTVWSDGGLSVVSGGGGANPPSVYPAYGYHIFYGDSAQSKASIQFTRASLGDILIIEFWTRDSQTDMASECSIVVLQTGINSASLFTKRGSRISSITITNNGLSAGTLSYGPQRLKLVCMAEAKWSIVEKTAAVDELAE
jgi:hypothetical protein